MSFEWNLSDDENGEDEGGREAGTNNWLSEFRGSAGLKTTGESEDDEEAEAGGFADDFDQPASFGYSATTVALLPGDGQGGEVGEEEDDEDDDEDDEIDWEDAGEDVGAVNDGTPSSAAKVDATVLRPVSIDLRNPREKKKEKKRAIKSRRSYRFDSLPPRLQSLLTQLEKAHLLCLTAHALSFSRRCSDETLQHLVQSLMEHDEFPGTPISKDLIFPIDRADPVAPTKESLHVFKTWFLRLINGAAERRGRVFRNRRSNRRKSKNTRSKASNHPEQEPPSTTSIHYRTDRYCSFLSKKPLDNEDRYLSLVRWNRHDKVQLLLLLARSLGWRARYVAALRPMKKNMNVDHPLFVAMNMQKMVKYFYGKKGPRKSLKPSSSKDNPIDVDKIDEAKPHLPSSIGSRLSSSNALRDSPPVLGWIEILCRRPPKRTRNGEAKGRGEFEWVHFDPESEPIGRDVPYVVAAEHLGTRARLTDVTPRYAYSWTAALQARGSVRGKKEVPRNERTDIWWNETVIKVWNAADRTKADLAKGSDGESVKPESGAKAIANGECARASADSEQASAPAPPASPLAHHDIDSQEQDELLSMRKNEPIPTSKAAFKTHPIYVISSVLNSSEVLAPDAKSRVCGVFKGELVYLRSDVHSILPAPKWLYHGRKVRADQLAKPVKRVKARKKPSNGNTFQALKSYGIGADNDGSELARQKEIDRASQPLSDGLVDVYAKFQTEPWSPAAVGPDDAIPVNEYKNIELELLNPGLTHVDEYKISVVAKKLEIPYAPCLLGFQGNHGNRTPSIRGIVVHDHNVEMLREAHAAMSDHLMAEEERERERAICLRWKRLMVGLLTKDRLEREYGGGE